LGCPLRGGQFRLDLPSLASTLIRSMTASAGIRSILDRNVARSAIKCL
jgi:hypothetical protein